MNENSTIQKLIAWFWLILLLAGAAGLVHLILTVYKT